MEIIALVLIVFLVIILQSHIYDKLAFSNLEYNCAFSEREVMEGGNVMLVETIYNGKLLPLPWIRAELQSSRWLEFTGSKTVAAQQNRYVTSNYLLRSYQKTTRSWRLKCTKRGIYKSSSAVLISGDLLGMRTRSKMVDVDASVTVYPVTVSLDELFFPANYLHGDTIVRRWIIDDPFIVSGAREYSPRDAMNRIHWAASAKTGRLMTRNNDYTSNPSMTVILNIQSLHHENDHVVFKDVMELGIRVAATLFDHALANGIPVRFSSNARICDPTGDDGDSPEQAALTDAASGREHVASLMKLLAAIEMRQKDRIERHLNKIAGKVAGSDVFFVTAYINEELTDLMRGLKEQGNNVAVIVLNPLESDDSGWKIPDDLRIFFHRREVRGK